MGKAEPLLPLPSGKGKGSAEPQLPEAAEDAPEEEDEDEDDEEDEGKGAPGSRGATGSKEASSSPGSLIAMTWSSSTASSSVTIGAPDVQSRNLQNLEQRRFMQGGLGDRGLRRRDVDNEPACDEDDDDDKLALQEEEEELEEEEDDDDASPSSSS